MEMDLDALLAFLRLAERLKGAPRHCFTTSGAPESVAAHAWRLALLAWLLAGEQPDVDMRRVVELALVHDLGEAVTGDIPSFAKTERDERVEADALAGIAELAPAGRRAALAALFAEWEAQRTREARFCRALDKLEAAIAHNESDIGTWLPLEYALNPVYGAEEAAEFPCLARLQARIRRDALKKIGRHTAAERKEGP